MFLLSLLTRSNLYFRPCTNSGSEESMIDKYKYISMHVYLFGKKLKGLCFRGLVGDCACTIHPKAAKENKILVLIPKKKLISIKSKFDFIVINGTLFYSHQHKMEGRKFKTKSLL